MTELNTERSTAEIFYSAVQLLDKMLERQEKMQVKELQIKMHDGIRLLTLQEVSRILAGLDVRKVKKLYDDGVLKGLKKNNSSVAIYSDSVQDYLAKTKTMIHDDYFSNEHNLMKKARVTRSEYDKLTNRN